MTKFAPALLATVALLSGCSQTPQTIREIGNAPSMSPIGSGLQFSQAPQLASYPKRPQNMNNGYSLWSDSQAALFKDARALNIGDILTVNIRINDKANFDNETDLEKTNSRKSGWNADATIFGWNPKTESTYGFDGTSEMNGKGSTTRAEQLNLLVAAVVTGVLDNGNLLISGSQEVRVNHEIRILNVAGIVRPQDVDAENEISYEKIAEARISYGGRGVSTDVQKPTWGQDLLNRITPF